MTCEQAMDALWPPERPRMAASDLLKARAHVDQCDRCRRFLTFDEGLRLSGGLSLPEAAPDDARERLFDSLARGRIGHGTADSSRHSEPRGLRGSGWLPGVGLVALLLILFAGVLVRNGPSRSGAQAASAGATLTQEESAAAFVDDFLRRAVQTKQLTTSDPREVVAFIRSELGLTTVPTLAVPALDLMGVEVCIVEGTRGAVVLYKRDGAVVYRYLIPGTENRGTGVTLARTGGSEWPTDDSEPVVVRWADASGLHQALVSDLPATELLSLAESMQSPVR